MSLRAQIVHVLKWHKVKVPCRIESCGDYDGDTSHASDVVNALATLLAPGPGPDRAGLEKILCDYQGFTHCRFDQKPCSKCKQFVEDVLTWASSGRSREQVERQVRDAITAVLEPVWPYTKAEWRKTVDPLAEAITNALCGSTTPAPVKWCDHAYQDGNGTWYVCGERIENALWQFCPICAAPRPPQPGA